MFNFFVGGEGKKMSGAKQITVTVLTGVKQAANNKRKLEYLPGEDRKQAWYRINKERVSQKKKEAYQNNPELHKKYNAAVSARYWAKKIINDEAVKHNGKYYGMVSLLRLGKILGISRHEVTKIDKFFPETPWVARGQINPMTEEMAIAMKPIYDKYKEVGLSEEFTEEVKTAWMQISYYEESMRKRSKK